MELVRVTDALPTDRAIVLGFVTISKFGREDYIIWRGWISVYFDITKGWFTPFSEGEDKNVLVTHWMPLPKLPPI